MFDFDKEKKDMENDAALFTLDEEIKDDGRKNHTKARFFFQNQS